MHLDNLLRYGKAQAGAARFTTARRLAPIKWLEDKIAFRFRNTRSIVIDQNARAVLTACKSDRSRLCGSVTPGGGRILRCFADNSQNLSASCGGAIIAVQPSSN